MTSSDEHLEQSLSEYNIRISELESREDKEALLEALAYRSTILLLLESYVSSITDVEDALAIYERIRVEGREVDPGILIRLYENRGQLCFDSDTEQMISDYDEISALLDKVGDSAKLYERRELITMCMDCAADLVDKDEFDRALPFASKALKVIGDGRTGWELNYLTEIHNVIGQAAKGKKDYEKAKDAFRKTISYCDELGEGLDDMMELAFAYVNLGDIAQEENDIPHMIEYHEKAIIVLTSMNDNGKLDDIKILIDLHNGLATILMDSGEVERAEKHLMASMALGMPGMDRTLNSLGITKK